MKIIIESTERFTKLDDVSVQVWKGATEQGIPCEALIASVGLTAEEDIERWLNEVAPQLPMDGDARIRAAVDFAVQFGGCQGDHHKAWVIDQMVRILAGSQYDAVVAKARGGDDGPETYSWDVGIPC